MKKKIFTLMSVALVAMTIGACSSNKGNTSSSSSSESITVRYTVAFEVDGERYKTVRVKEGETITETIANPEKEGFEFVGWEEDGVVVDLTTYVVTHDVTLTAKWKEAGDVLNVDDVKDATKTYHLVLGWWESTNTESSSFPYSGMTRETTRTFYKNLIKYLKATGSTDEQIAAISFRNYSSYDVASMGSLINADADVDLMIGVGANIFTTAGVSPYNTTDDSKFKTVMGNASKERYVALIKDARDLAKTVYDWLDNSDLAKEGFLRELTDEEIQQTLVPETINLSVTVHGDTTITTLLDSKDKVVEMPVITVADDKVFKGFATSEGGEVVLNKAKDATLKYDDLKAIAGESTTLDLYPVIENAPVVSADLVVYVQTGSNLTAAEASLLEQRYKSTLGDETVKFVQVEGNAATFTAAVEADSTVDVVIGGNNPISTYSLLTDYGVVNAGAKHFANTSRKIAILASCNTAHVDLAKSFYSFVSAEATAYSMKTAFWTKANSWVTAEEVTAIEAGIDAQVATYLGVDTTTTTLADAYNVSVDYQECPTDITGVAAMGTWTNALYDGKGPDLLVGCGANVTSTGLVDVVEKKTIGTTFVAATGRYVALVHENALARNVYENYFVEAVSTLK